MTHWTMKKWPGIVLAALVGSVSLWATIGGASPTATPLRTQTLIVDGSASVGGVLTVGSCVGCGGGGGSVVVQAPGC